MLFFLENSLSTWIEADYTQNNNVKLLLFKFHAYSIIMEFYLNSMPIDKNVFCRPNKTYRIKSVKNSYSMDLFKSPWY